MNSLYCYLASEGLTFLKKGFLPFQSLEQMPEPWLQTNTCYKEQQTSQLSAKEYQRHLQQQYQQLPEHLRAMVSFEYFVQQSQAKRGQIEKALAQQQAVSSAESLFDLSRLQDWRILRLYSQWNDVDLWQVAGAQGQGMLLEIDVVKTGFQTTDYNQQAQHFSKVTRVSPWQPLDDLYYLFNRPVSNTDSMSELADKEGVEEWRLVRSIHSADRKIDVQGASRAMYRLPAKAIKRVILGYRSQQADCQKVKSYLKQDIHYRHVECVQAQLDLDTMQLQLVPI